MYIPKKRRGLFGGVSEPQAGLQQEIPQPTEKQDGGFFGQGGVGRAIAGTIGDVLLQRNGMAPIYAPAMRDQQQQMQAAAQQAAAQRQKSVDRQNSWEDWQRRQQWQIDNPKPANNDTVNDVNWWMGASPEERAAYQEMNPEYRQGGDGRFYRIDTGGNRAAPTKPVGKLTPMGGMTPQGAAPVLQGAASTNMVSRADAQRVRDSLGPNGQDAFEQWMRENNIQVSN